MSDVNYKSFADVSNLTLRDLTVDPASEGLDSALFDDLFKLSHVTGAYIAGLIVRGGHQRENAIDMNRECSDVTIDGASLQARVFRAKLPVLAP